LKEAVEFAAACPQSTSLLKSKRRKYVYLIYLLLCPFIFGFKNRDIIYIEVFGSLFNIFSMKFIIMA